MSQEDRMERLQSRNFYDELIRLRDEQREQKSKAYSIVKGKYLPQELNPQGLMKWYQHPMIDDTVIKSQIFWVQEIPPGSKSGKQKSPGGTVIYVWGGKGHTTIDGVRYDWQERDVINLPMRTEGIVVQHFNDHAENPVRLLCVEPNFVHTLGVDRGSGFEQLEEAPEYRNRK